MLVKVIARDLKYAGRTLRPGSVVDMDRKHARVFQALGRIQPEVEADTVTAPVGFEDSIVAAQAQAELAEGEEEKTGNKVRRYKRRDMRAE